MPNKGTTMNIILSCTIADDQLTAKVNGMTVEGNYSNPDGSPSNKISEPIKPAHPTFDGTKDGSGWRAPISSSERTESMSHPSG